MTLLASFVCAAIFIAVYGSVCVDPNKQFFHCGSSCPKNCNDLNPVCERLCREGCGCKPGFILTNSDPESMCIREEECSGREQGDVGRSCIDPNKEWRDCARSCARTCQDPQPRCRNRECHRGCVCKTGYVYERNSLTARCIPLSQCSTIEEQTCAARKRYDYCGTACPAHCGNLQPTICTDQCVVGCVCRTPYVLTTEDPDSPCVLPNDCPHVSSTECPRHMHRETCGTACPAICGDLNPICASCVTGCFCDEGYILESDAPGARCVRMSECPRVITISCPPHMHMDIAAPTCPVHCGSPNRRCSSYTRGCVCDDNYILESDAPYARCVRRSECRPPPAQRCPLNTHYVDCANECQATCDNPRPDRSFCSSRCVRGCVCDVGYIRESNNVHARCIRIDQCNRRGPSRTCNNRLKEYKYCGSSCPDSCENLDRNMFVHSPCSRECVEGCFCRDGYVLETNDPESSCILQSECGARSPTHESGTAQCNHASDRDRTCLTHDEAFRRVRHEGILVYSLGRCYEKTFRLCTSLEGVQEDTIDSLIEIKEDSGCALTIVNGTEPPQKPRSQSAHYRRYSHENGWRLDIERDRCIDRYVTGLTHQGQGRFCDPECISFDNKGTYWDISFAALQNDCRNCGS